MNPKFSIIVPVYQAEVYLHRCIESILSQTLMDFELLLIDDGSRDRSGTICDEYAAEDVRVRVFHKSNGGVSAARNWGLKHAQGEWITFVDADDWIAENFLEIMLQQAIKEQADAVLCNCFYVHNEQIEPKWIYRKNAVETGSNILKRLLSKFGMRSEVWGKIFKRKILIDRRLSEDMTIGEDLLFLIELYAVHPCKTVIIKEPLYYYRQVQTSAMNTTNLIENNRRLLFHYLEWAADHSEISRDLPQENALFIVRLASSVMKRDFWNQSKDAQLVQLLKENYKTAKPNLLRSEKRFLRSLFLSPKLGRLAMKIEDFSNRIHHQYNEIKRNHH
ncbi:MAG: glycosyltransferase [Dysgonamonadaceae bacterium]|jgi:glycosyltransferase involved in cell wall biosynthesis|nr:glycosyltransferase [Dysgonamonadaceae bacterium]